MSHANYVASCTCGGSRCPIHDPTPAVLYTDGLSLHQIEEAITLTLQSVHPDRPMTDAELQAFYQGRSAAYERLRLVVQTLAGGAS